MKISLETAALGVAGSDQARPGGLELEQLGSQLCLQPGVLEGEKRGGACGLEDRTLADQPIVVDDGCEGTLGGPITVRARPPPTCFETSSAAPVSSTKPP